METRMIHIAKINMSSQRAPCHDVEFVSIPIVDDECFDRKSLRHLCKDLPFATNLVEAASLHMSGDKLTKDHFDLILLDYHIADGTGLEKKKYARDRANNKTEHCTQAYKAFHANMRKTSNPSSAGSCARCVT